MSPAADLSARVKYGGCLLSRHQILVGGSDMIPVPMVILRECRKCGWRGPLTGFVEAKTCHFGRRHICFPCEKKRSTLKSRRMRLDPAYVKRERAEKNRKRRERYANDPAHREEIKEINRQQRVLHGDERRAQARTPEAKQRLNTYRRERYASDEEYRERLKTQRRSPEVQERHNELARQRYKEDPEFRADRIIRAARRRLIQQEDFSLGTTCAYCGTSGKMTHDHMIPVDFYEKGIVDEAVVAVASNIVPACKSCNCMKSNKLPGDPELLARVEDLLGYDPKERFPEECFWSGRANRS